MGGLFYNIHPLVDEDRIVAQWNAWKPPAAVVMDNPGLAQRLIDERPDALVIARHFQHDEKIANLGTPSAWLDWMINAYPDPGIVLYAGNECHASKGVDKWMVETMRMATDRGRRLCIVNSGTGGPEDEEWWSEMPPTSTDPGSMEPYRIGILEDVVIEFFKPEHKAHIWGFHEYIPNRDYRTDPDGWQIGRIYRHAVTIVKFLASRGIFVTVEEVLARFIVTEATMDETEHSTDKGSRWLEPDDAARQMIAIDNEIYRGIPVCMYCIGSNNDPKWSMFRLDNTDKDDTSTDEWGAEFQRIIGAYMVQSQNQSDSNDETSEDQTMIDMENRETVEVWPVNDWANIRGEAGGEDIGDLKARAVASRTVENKEAMLDGKAYNWRHYQFVDGIVNDDKVITEGWLADESVNVETVQIEDPADDDDEVIPDDDTDEPAEETPDSQPTPADIAFRLQQLEELRLMAETCAASLRVMAGAMDHVVSFCIETAEMIQAAEAETVEAVAVESVMLEATPLVERVAAD